MTDESALVPQNVDLTSDAQWHEIVDALTAAISKDDLPEQVVQATEMLLAGFPTYKVAKKLNVKTSDVQIWLRRYPIMAATLKEGQALLTKWRMAKLEQQFLLAVERSEEILEMDFNDENLNAKVAATVAQHSRFIISLFAGQKLDVNVHFDGENPELKASKDALNYLLTRLNEQRSNDEPIEATYRVVDEKNESGPIVNPDGTPYHGSAGRLDRNDEGTLCHICGARFKYLSIHIRTRHQISIEAYETAFLLQRGSVNETEKPA